MTEVVVLLLPEYQYLQLVQRVGPFEAPRGGPDHVSAEYLMQRGLLETVDGQIAVTLLGAVAAAATAREIDGTAVAIDRALLDECRERERGGGGSGALGDRPEPQVSPTSVLKANDVSLAPSETAQPEITPA